MPSWQPEWRDVRFDHAACEVAVAACRAAASQLGSASEVLEVTARTATADWTGAARGRFVTPRTWRRPTKTPVTGRRRRLVVTSALFAVLAGCASSDDPVPTTAGQATDPTDGTTEGTDVADVTEQPAEDVDLEVVLERTVVGGDPAVRIAVRVSNRRDADVAVVTPALGTFTDGEDGTIVVRADAAELEDAPIDDTTDDGDGGTDAPPIVPGVVVSAGDTIDLEVAVTATPDAPPAVEVCVEVQSFPDGATTGDEVSLTDTASDGVRELACGRADVPAR